MKDTQHMVSSQLILIIASTIIYPNIFYRVHVLKRKVQTPWKAPSSHVTSLLHTLFLQPNSSPHISLHPPDLHFTSEIWSLTFLRWLGVEISEKML